MATRRTFLLSGLFGLLGCLGSVELRYLDERKEDGVMGDLTKKEVDVLIVGGGPAGMSAALYLGRARKRVLVIDAGEPRHRVSKGVHNFLTREGISPDELRQIAWSQMKAYPSVERTEGYVESAEQTATGWRVRTREGGVWEGRALLLAVGVIDHHPTIRGYSERWGESIHHCPYCHGWEMKERPLAVLASGKPAQHLAPLLRGWSDDVILLTNGEALDAEDEEVLQRYKIPIYRSPVVSLEGPGSRLQTISLEDGTSLAREGLFVAGKQSLPTWVSSLGMDVTEEGYIRVDMMQKTNLPMLWAAGDCTSRMQQVLEAAAQGGRAGAIINATLTLSH